MFLDSTYVLIYNTCFSLSDFLHAVCQARFTHIMTNDSILFLFMPKWYSIVYTYHIFFIQSSVCRHLGCFLVYCKQHCDEQCGTCVFLIYGFLRYVFSSGIAGSYGSLIFSFLMVNWTSVQFFKVVVSTCVPTSSVRGFPFPHTLSSISTLSNISSMSVDFFWCWPFWLVWDDTSL